MTFESQTFHSERKGDCFTVRPCGDDVELCILQDGAWSSVADFHSPLAAKKYIDYMVDFLETYEPKEQ